MNKTGKKWILLTAALCMLAGLLTGCSGGRTLDPTEYVHLELSGLNGEGTGRVALDGEAIIEVIEEKKDLTTRNREELEALLKDAEKDFSMSEKSGLSNGDEITVKSDMQKNVLKEYGIIIKNGSVVLTVDGLIDVREVALKDYAVTEFSGFEGHGYANVYLDFPGLRGKVKELAASVAGDEKAEEFVNGSLNSYLEGIQLSQTYFENLSGGDEITCAVTMEKDLIEEFGIRFVTGDISAKAEGLIPVTDISMMDYAVLETDGFEGHGNAEVLIDTDALASDLAKLFEEQDRGMFGLLEEGTDIAVEAENAAYYIRSSFTGLFGSSLDRSSDLSEGDTVKFSAVLPEGADSYIDRGFTLTGGEKEFTVSGLIPTIDVSISDFLLPEYTGFNGDGRAAVGIDEDALADYLQGQFENLSRGWEGSLKEGTDTAAEAERAASRIMNFIQGDFTQTISGTEQLSDGDTLDVSFRTEDESTELYDPDSGIYIRGGETQLTVEGLVPTLEVNLCDFIVPVFEGFSGAGTAYVYLDHEAAVSWLTEQFETLGRGVYGPAPAGTDYAAEAENAVWTLDNALYDFGFSQSADSGLTNGDEISISYTSETEGPVYYPETGIFVNGGEKTFTAEGLTEPQLIDLADDVTVTFSGVTPDVYVSREINWEAPYIYSTSLADDYDEKLYAWNGDKYEFDVTYDAQELLLMGYVVSNAHVETQISGLNSYMITAAAADDPEFEDLWDAYEEEARREIRSQGNYILDRQEEHGQWIVWSDSVLQRERVQVQYASSLNEGTGNGLYLVYRYDIAEKMADHSEKAYPVWYVAGMQNLEETPEGSLSYDGSSGGSVFYSAQEVNDYLAQQKSYLSESASAVDLEYPEEENASEKLSGEDQVGRDAAAVQAPSAGEADSAALSQAASVIVYQGHTYARYDNIISWTQAETFCQKAGGHLATVTSRRENQVIRALLKDAPLGEYYLGGSDTVFEGDWNWSDGEPFSYNGWASGQPDNYRHEQGDEDYLETGSAYDYKFNDTSLNAEAGYILEVDPAVEEENVTWLADLQPVHLYYADYQDSVTDHYGNDHFGSMYLDASNRGSMEYDLGGKYSRLTGSISTFADAQSDAVFEIVIWGDGEILFSGFNYRKTEAPMNLDIDLTGVQRLTIESINRGGYNYGYLFINDAKLTKADEPVPAKTAGLKDVSLISSVDVDAYTEKGLPTDAQGSVHRDAWYFRASGNAKAAWQLGGAWTTLRCTVSGQDEYGNISIAGARILADGNVVWIMDELSAEDGYQELTLDVTGVQVLEFETRNSGEGGNPVVFLSDTLLTGDAPEAAAEETEEALLAPEAVASRAAKVIVSEGKEYYRFDEPMSRNMAVRFVQAAGGVLAAPSGPAEDAAFRKLVEGGIYQDYWLAGSQDYEFAMSTDDPEAVTGFVMELTDADIRDSYAGSEYLSDMEWTASGGCDETEVTSGNRFFYSSIRLDGNNRGYVQTDLNGRYDRLTVLLLWNNENSVNAAIQFGIFGDGKLLKEIRNINKTTGKQYISVDVTGVSQLYISAVNTGENNRADVFLCTPRLYLAKDSTAGEKITRLNELSLIDSSDNDEDTCLVSDSYGELYDRYLVLNADEGGHMLWNLDGKYASFSGRITAAAKTDLFDSAHVRILLDGEEVYDSGLWKSTDGAMDFEVDVTGASTLEIAAESEYPENGQMYVYIMNDRLIG